jgi:uncharacterized membrane protein YhaH (DUF805 family)
MGSEGFGFSGDEIKNMVNGIGIIYNLFTTLPSISIAVRRLHDMGRSGWWCLIAIIPLLGWIIILIMCMFDTEPFPNEYGESSKIGVVNLIYDEDDDVIELIEAEIIE